MERRHFLKAFSGSLAAGTTSGCANLLNTISGKEDLKAAKEQDKKTLGLAPSKPPVLVRAEAPSAPAAKNVKPATKAERQAKSRQFSKTFEDDIFIDPRQIATLKSINSKLWQTRKALGFGHFNLIGFDELVKFCKYSSYVKELSKAELAFFDQMFHEDAKRYGFYGEKPIEKMTANILKKDAVKVKGTGHYVFKGEPLTLYNKIIKELGTSIVLTSGIRGVVKQMHLFLTKAISVDGNLSKASRSLAPPGHSFHGIGDFDVGKVGFGSYNFTDKFATTEEYKSLINSGYIQIRYTQDNPFGVRYEPWHIKVIS